MLVNKVLKIMISVSVELHPVVLNTFDEKAKFYQCR